MHSRIYEIKAENFGKYEEWANANDIADGDGNIEGADYWGRLNEKDRVENIELFFTKWFPGNSFKIIKNEPGKTAVVKFVGDINALFQQWMNEIKAAADKLTIEEMSRSAVFEVRMACQEALGLSSKFYLNEWNGCTTCSDDLLCWLRYLSEKNNGKPFKLYIGQVFDYHW